MKKEQITRQLAEKDKNIADLKSALESSKRLRKTDKEVSQNKLLNLDKEWRPKDEENKRKTGETEASLRETNKK